MLHVIGTQDPFAAVEAAIFNHHRRLARCDAHFVQFFEKNGLHPYRLHIGIRYRPGCDECLGQLCYKTCRADVRSVLAESAKKPTIMARSEVVKLEALPGPGDACHRAPGITSRSTVQARIFVLAAGAIHSPKLLLRSKNDHWPEGLANRSGLVGRNLMFHARQTSRCGLTRNCLAPARESRSLFATSIRWAANVTDLFNPLASNSHMAGCWCISMTALTMVG